MKRDLPEALRKGKRLLSCEKAQKVLCIRSAHAAAYAPALWRRGGRIHSPAVLTKAALV